MGLRKSKLTRCDKVNALPQCNPLYTPYMCSICLENITKDYLWCKVCEKPSHRQCIKKWKKGTCPLCRGILISR